MNNDIIIHNILPYLPNKDMVTYANLLNDSYINKLVNSMINSDELLQSYRDIQEYEYQKEVLLRCNFLPIIHSNRIMEFVYEY